MRYFKVLSVTIQLSRSSSVSDSDFHIVFVCFFLLFQALTHVYAKNIAAFVCQEAGNRPVLLGLALKDCSAENLKTLKEMIKSCQVW